MSKHSEAIDALLDLVKRLAEQPDEPNVSTWGNAELAHKRAMTINELSNAIADIRDYG